MFENIEFLNKELFWFLLLLPIAIAWYVFKRNQQTAELKISSIKGFKTSSSFWSKFRHVLFALRIIALGLLIRLWQDREQLMFQQRLKLQEV